MAAVALAAATASALSQAPASAVSAPLSSARIAAHSDLARGQMPENLALAPGGRAYVTFAKGRQVAEGSLRGTVRIPATLPRPADGGVHTPAMGFPLAAGIVRAHDGTLSFLYATGTADLTGLWRMRPGGRPERIATLPADGLPNGLVLDARTHTLYVADSVLGAIWTVPTTGGTPTARSTAPELAPTGFLGANGLKTHNGGSGPPISTRAPSCASPSSGTEVRAESRLGPAVCRGSTTSPSLAVATGSWPPWTDRTTSRSTSPTAAIPPC
ncbi:hypothetical protein [Streptomyces sp. OE57]|uniref:hypothetical protein n=1 Tax=Streptomyces lacaronensis TaxID=3379885 RepID=UPI0039B73CED